MTRRLPSAAGAATPWPAGGISPGSFPPAVIPSPPNVAGVAAAFSALIRSTSVKAASGSSFRRSTASSIDIVPDDRSVEMIVASSSSSIGRPSRISTPIASTG